MEPPIAVVALIEQCLARAPSSRPSSRELVELTTGLGYGATAMAAAARAPAIQEGELGILSEHALA